MRTFPPKDPGESRILTIYFTNDVPAGVTLSNPVLNIGPYSGVPDPAMASMLVGAPQITSTALTQMCTAGVSFNTYAVTGYATGSDGEVYSVGGILPIVPAAYQ